MKLDIEMKVYGIEKEDILETIVKIESFIKEEGLRVNFGMTTKSEEEY